jgi:hypothetical protein
MNSSTFSVWSSLHDMRNIKRLVVLSIVFIALIAAVVFLLPKGPKIIIRNESDVKETIYTLEDNSISLTTYDTEINEHILRLRSKSELPLKEQVAIISRILKKVPKERQFRTFFIGRLIDAFGADKTLSERLSSVAAQSPLWDKAKGHPRTGHENQCVKEIANQAMIYPELKEMFAKHGYEIEVSSVEKVLIDPQTKLPYDCMTWFSLSKL